MPSLAALYRQYASLLRLLYSLIISSLILYEVYIPAYARAPLVNLGNATAAGEDSPKTLFDNLSHNIFDIPPLGSLYSLLSPFPNWSNHLTLLGAMGGCGAKWPKSALF
ncbi:hypothetical protein [Bombella sp. ESL0378]|uniref:hypothetical protein n=1 Tax=Bombella sp. ESL0378 TaxID=2676442 RepID=UPI001E3FBC92|nr:hypothetical protein [Bombella sp. ESL0378]